MEKMVMELVMPEGPLRRWLRDRQPLLKPGLLPSVHGIDGALESAVDEKKKAWRERGHTDRQIEMAVNLAKEWAYSMSEAFAPPEQLAAAVNHNLPKGLDVADRWLLAFSEK